MEAVTSALPAADEGDERTVLFRTALGLCGIAWSARGITRFQLPEADEAATALRLGRRGSAASSPPAEIAGAIGLLCRYFTGEAVEFPALVLDPGGTGAFDRAVYQATREIGWGKTATYGALARKVGSPGAARAVGQAMAHNPVPVIVPCHRVLAEGGRPGGFSAYGGRLTKQRLLALEGVHAGGTPFLPGLLD